MDPHEAAREFVIDAGVDEIDVSEPEEIAPGHLELVGDIELDDDIDSENTEAFLHLVGPDAVFDDPEELSTAVEESDLDLTFDHTRVSSDVVRDFANRVSGHKILTREEEVAYFKKIKKGDQKAREEFILHNQKLVMSIAFANLFRTNSSLGIEDLIVAGNEGLERAVDKFDEARGNKFSTYATWWIKQKIQRTFQNESSTIRLPVHVKQDVSKVQRAKRTLAQQGIIDPTPEQLSDKSGLPIDKVSRALRAEEISQPASLNKKLDDETDTEMGDSIDNGDVPIEDQVMHEMRISKLLESVGKLSREKRKILTLYYGLDGKKEKNKSVIMRQMKIGERKFKRLFDEAHEDLKAIIGEEDDLCNISQHKRPELPAVAQKERKKRPKTLSEKELDTLSNLAQDHEELANSSGRSKEQIIASRNSLSTKINLKIAPMILLSYHIGSLEFPEELDRLIVRLDKLYMTPKERTCLQLSSEGITVSQISESSGMDDEEVKAKLKKVKYKIGKDNLPTKFAVLIAHILGEIDLPKNVLSCLKEYNLKSATEE